MYQDFRFKYESAAEVQAFLRSFDSVARVEDRGEFFVFTQKDGPEFSFDCAIETYGLRTNRSHNYFKFLGQFVESITGQFGPVEIEDV